MSVTDPQSGRPQVLELAADGSASQTLSLPGGGCPLLQAARSGLLVSVPSRDGVDLTVYAASGGVVTEVARLSQAALGGRPFWLAQAEDGSLFMLILVADGMQLIRVDPDRKGVPLSDVLPFADVVPSEPGTLFLHAAAPPDANGLRQHRLLQIVCAIPESEIAG